MKAMQARLTLMRLPFVTASIIPFLIGSAYVYYNGGARISGIRFFLGLMAAVCGHIGANILNDYFDSKSGNDWKDLRKHIFFGGSKIIQDGLMTEGQVFRTGAVFIIASFLCLAALQVIMPAIPIILFGVFILFLAYCYTAPPLKLVYRGFGEAVIFLLFGVAIVAGACTVLTSRLFTFREILLSLPISFLVTAILYVNEVPDYNADRSTGKNNLVVRIGPERAWIGYLALVAGAFAAIVLCAARGVLPPLSLSALIPFVVYVRAVTVLKRDWRDIEKLKVASKCTIAGHLLVGMTLVVTVLLSGSGLFTGARLGEYKRTQPYFGTHVTIRCFFDKDKDIAPAINECWERMDRIQAEMSAYSDTGDVALINSFGPEGVRVGPYTFELLREAVRLSEKTEGSFDVTVGPLVRLWKDAAKKNTMPTERELGDARSKVGYKNIVLTPSDHVRLAKEGVKVDLGGIASGYACDQIANILKYNGIENFMIDAGGEIVCSGLKGGRRPWVIAIQDPFHSVNVIGKLSISNRSISTSGSYEKTFIVGGRKLSHIINPATGMPEEDIISATVIANTGVEADALSTALCVLGREKGFDIARSMDGVEAMLIEKRGDTFSRYQTDGFQRYSSE